MASIKVLETFLGLSEHVPGLLVPRSWPEKENRTFPRLENRGVTYSELDFFTNRGV